MGWRTNPQRGDFEGGLGHPAPDPYGRYAGLRLPSLRLPPPEADQPLADAGRQAQGDRKAEPGVIGRVMLSANGGFAG